MWGDESAKNANIILSLKELLGWVEKTSPTYVKSEVDVSDEAAPTLDESQFTSIPSAEGVAKPPVPVSAEVFLNDDDLETGAPRDAFTPSPTTTRSE